MSGQGDIQHSIVAADGRSFDVVVRVNGRARRIALRVDTISGEVVLTVPHRRALREGLAFAESRTEWLAGQFAALPPRRDFIDGGEIPFRGVAHRLRHRSDRRGTVWLESGEIHVAGRPEHMERRLRDWLKEEARKAISSPAHDLARQVDRRITGISIRDQRSRWGSCSPSGRLNFSWRLVLAPVEVCDYVIAHEVAHLVHHDHSPRFWALVDRLCPDHRRQRAWLRHHGATLQRVG